MALGIDKIAWEHVVVSVLAKKAAANNGGYNVKDAMETVLMEMQRMSKWRGPALTSPQWRAWTPEAPGDQMTSAALRPPAGIPALTSPLWRA